jgi:GntR family transcriptional regulator
MVTPFMVDRSLPTPLYWQLKEQILKHIDDGSLAPGDWLPSESELCQELRLSRPTIRQALSELAMEGVIEKARGRGSFVARPKIDGGFLSKLQTFAEEMRQQHLTPSTRLISLDQVAGIPKINDRLGLPLAAPLIALVRLRLADDVPVVHVETYLPYETFPSLVEADLENASLYDTLEREHAVRVSRVTRQIEAVVAGRHDTELLGVSLGAAICLTRTVAYADEVAGPVEYSVARYRGDMTQFSLELYR